MDATKSGDTVDPEGSSSEYYSTEEVSDETLEMLAKYVPHSQYVQLADGLGMDYNQANNILDMNRSDYSRSIRHCLGTWKNRTGGSLAELKRILIRSDLVSLVQYVEQGGKKYSRGSPREFDSTEEVSDETLEMLAKYVPHSHYYELSGGLGMDYNQANNILSMNGSDFTRSIRQWLRTWKDRTGGSLTELKRILIQSNLGILVPYVEQGGLDLTRVLIQIYACTRKAVEGI